MICIPLSHGKFVLIDNEDWERASQLNWRLQTNKSTCYAVAAKGTKQGYKKFYMHRFLLGLEDKTLVVDHKDRNGLNNTRENLRVCTKTQNMQNSKSKSNNKHGLKGVHYHAQTGLWHSHIRHEGKRKSLGYFSTKEEAHKAYCDAANIMHGEFACTG